LKFELRKMNYRTRNTKYLDKSNMWTYDIFSYKSAFITNRVRQKMYSHFNRWFLLMCVYIFWRTLYITAVIYWRLLRSKIWHWTKWIGVSFLRANTHTKKTYRSCQKHVSVTFHWWLLLGVQFATSINLNICTVVKKKNHNKKKYNWFAFTTHDYALAESIFKWNTSVTIHKRLEPLSRSTSYSWVASNSLQTAWKINAKCWNEFWTLL
jgi:hypothetical protein